MESTPSTHRNARVDAGLLRARNLDRAGFTHGFSLRRFESPIEGEDSAGALDFGPTASAEARAHNVRRFAAAVGFAADELRQVNQVHGARVVRGIDAREDPREEADAIVADAEAGACTVGVRVADCVPVLVGDRRIGAVAAIHAGWRGVVGGVIGAAIAELATIGSGDYVAAIGPCIGACCFEVGSDVADAIARACGADVIAAREGAKARVDLRRAVRAQLEKAHVRDVEDVPGCTKCDAERFFSYRRDAERSGRHLAVISARSSAPISHRSFPA